MKSQASLVAKLSLIHLLLVPFLDFFRSQQSLHNPLYGYQSLQPVSGRKNQLTTIRLVCSITLFDSKRVFRQIHNMHGDGDGEACKQFFLKKKAQKALTVN